MNKRFAVLGSPIAHSKSPAIHLAAYRVLGLDWEYGRAEVQKGLMRTFIAGLDGVWNGFSVTMPLKEEASRFAEDLDEYAKLTGATNTLYLDEFGKWHGFNTDVFGIVQAVTEARIGLVKHALIIGSGATATSAMVAISVLNPNAHVEVLARNKVSRKSLIALGKQLGLKATRAGGLRAASRVSNLTISTLPSGALDKQAARLIRAWSWKPKGALLDVSYNPWPSKLAEAWSAKGKRTISGLEMLIWQAVAQIRIFNTGSADKELPNEVAVVSAMHIAVESEQ
ncbi:MAG: shikimate dehydrogenase [Rhodoluna sp.]|nr:shikimate dehydrogenase [Rhodoluna sp.]